MGRDWVGASGDPVDPEGEDQAPGQLELSMPGTPPLRPPASPTIRYWRTSLAPDELEDYGSFDYNLAPELFLGRTGWGPLRVACDTNIYIDIRDHAHLLFDEEDPNFAEQYPAMDDRHAVEIAALLRLIELWWTRDIRLVHFERQATDSRKPSARFDVDERLGHIQELNAGWAHVIPTDSAGLPLGAALRLPGLPANTDGELVALAIQSGCHVFLTGDLPVHRLSVRTRSMGLKILAPTGLIAAIEAAGEMTPVGAEGGICDNHKVVHLQRVVDPGNAG